MIMRAETTFLLCVAFAAVSAATPTAGGADPGPHPMYHPSDRRYFCTEATPNARPIAPLFRESLSSVSIAAGPRDELFLTGLPVVNGTTKIVSRIPLWRRAGQTWGRAGEINVSPHRASSVRLLFHGGGFHLTFGAEDGSTYLASTKGRTPTAADWRIVRIAGGTRDAALFVDDDGTAYWVVDRGRIARLNDDWLEGLAEPLRQIEIPPRASQASKDPSRLVGTHGAFLTKLGGRYCLFAADRPTKGGFGRAGVKGGAHDTFVATAQSLDGPWTPRYLAFPHAGAVTIFHQGEQVWATFNGDDSGAAIRQRPAMFEVEVADVEPALHFPDGKLIRPKPGIIFGADPVYQIQPGRVEVPEGARDDEVRDTYILPGRGGTYLMTGTLVPRGVPIWESKDLHTWTFKKNVWSFDKHGPEWWFNRKPEGRRYRVLWAPEIHDINGRFWIPFNTGQTFESGLLKGTTNSAVGTYEPVNREKPMAKWIDASLFQDDDGQVYYVWQADRIAPLNEDLTRFAGKMRRLRDADNQKIGYEGIQLTKIGDWYVIVAAEWNGDERSQGSYDMMYGVSKKLFGPYSRRRLAVPHAGHGMLFKSHDGQWQASMFGNDRTAPFRKRPGVVPLVVQDTGADLLIRTARSE